MLFIEPRRLVCNAHINLFAGFASVTVIRVAKISFSDMSGLARKLVICAAIEGLVIQPLTTKGQRPANPIRIRYSDAAISAITRDQLPDISQEGSSFEAFGVIGRGFLFLGGFRFKMLT